MSNTSADASTSHHSSSDESIPLTNSKKGVVATTSKPTVIKKSAAVVADQESESSDSESEPLVATKKANSRKGHAIKKAAAVEADPESESADSESEMKTKARSSNIKKTAAESETKPKGARRERSTTKKAAVVSKPSTPAKRVAVVSPDEPSAKKGKSTGRFQRLWTEEDEVTVLKLMVKYKEEKGVYATKAFHAFVKDAMLVDFDFDSEQLAGKVRKLKSKYKKSFRKKNLTPHEEELRKLSKLIWDSSPIVEKEQVSAEDHAEDDAEEDAENDAAEEDPAEDEADADDEDNAEDETNNVCKTKKEWKFIGKKSIAMGFDAETMNAGLERCSDAAKVEIEEEWEQYHLKAAALFQKQLDLVIKETNCAVQALNK